MVLFHRNIVCFRTVIEEMVKITIPVVVIGTLAIILLIVLIYLRRKNGKIFCEKPFQKGNSYLKLHCPIFLLFQYQMILYTNQLLEKFIDFRFFHQQDQSSFKV